MSRTHKTKPFWVKMKQGHLATMELHDHRDGPCDLPDSVELDEWTRKNRCRHDFKYTGTHVCCCSLCHGDPWSAGPGKRQRREGKRYVQKEWAQEY